MPDTSLFNQRGQFHEYSDTARKLHSQVVEALQPIMKQYHDKDYSPREISYLMVDAVKEVELEANLTGFFINLPLEYKKEHLS